MNESNSKSELSELHEIRMNEFCVNYLKQPIVINVQPPELVRPKCSVSPIDLSILNENSVAITATSCDFQIQNESFLPNVTNNYSHISPFINRSECLKPLQPMTTQQSYHSFYDSGIQQSFESNNNSNVSAILTSSPYYQNKPSAFKHLSKRLNYLCDKPVNFQSSTPNKAQNAQADSVINQSTFNNSIQTTSRVNFHSILDLAKSHEQLKPNQEQVILPSITISASFVKENSEKKTNNKNESNSLINFNEHLKMLSMELNNKENSITQKEFFSKNKRKPRTQITRQQREILEYAYQLKGYPDSNEIEYLCNLLGFEENVIRIWFQNKRARDKQRHQ